MIIDEIIMDFKKIHKFLKTFFLLPAVYFLACSSPKNQSDEIILAKIGEKEISVKEFLQRSELTIRPNNFKSKNTTLNNLISEKILALEAGYDNKILLNPAFQSRLKGIKEQFMRDKLYYEVAYNKVKLDSHEVNNAYKLSMREYELEFYTIHNKELAQKIAVKLDSMPELADQMFKEVEEILGKKPVQKVKYKDQEDDVIHEALFTRPLELGTLIGPLRLSNGDYLVMRVLNWVDYPLVSDTEQQVRWQEVQEKIHQTKAQKLWRSYQTKMMDGKKIEFDEQSFKVLSHWAMEKYLSRDENDSLNFQITEIPSAKPEIDLNAPFFTIGNKLWTVDDFKNELMSHPLVFRTKYLNRDNFAEQLKLAIVDMMRDHYLTQEAYKKSLDESEEINKTVTLWKDAFLADYQKNSIIQSALKQGIVNKNDKSSVLKYWESYVLNLQKNYSHSIKINYNELDKICLTNIDFLAIRPGVPYPIAVPGFPTLIASENLDYAKQGKSF